MTASEDNLVTRTIRITTLAPLLFIGISSILLEIVLFFEFSTDQRDFDAKMAIIRAGQVSRETLTVKRGQ